MFVDEDEDFEIINGKRVLRDQHRIRVRLADAQHSRARASLTDGRGAPHMVGHRPGFIISRDARQQDAREQAYLDYQNWVGNRWRDQDEDDDPPNGPPAGAYPYTASAEGGACTINGFSGTLRRKGDWLVCIPNRQGFNGAANGDEDPDLDPEMAQSDRRSVADIQKAHAQNMARLIAERDAETQNAWRKR
jgi:hypothetical protein